MTVAEQASVSSVLSALTIARIQEIGRDAGLAPRGSSKQDLVRAVEVTKRISFRRLLAQLRRDELRAACRAHGLDDTGRARQALMQRLLEAHGAHDSAPPPPLFTGTARGRDTPDAGDTVIARHRQWLVDEVRPPPNEGDATWLSLTCLDDDNRGQTLELLWELELGARVIQPEAPPFEAVERLDPPRQFTAYLHTLRWQSVTAADRDFFQAPFRAGIEVLDHQLTPLAKALSLPRANLFIADDVGLGKTIEAGLVLQELLLRQRVEMALIVCPASVTLQWQREMDQRFGLRFEIYSRDFVLARRRERGFAVNPWDTHTRFIISYPLLRRPEYRDPLLAHLGKLSERSTRAKKSLLILDEAHTAAPASGGRYAVDSRITRVVRDIAPRFENRLFLSATPHNGHSNSFSALLEILDPQRFARGVPVKGREELAPVMVRRLKRDLRELGKAMRFPRRDIVRVALTRGDDGWMAKLGDEEPFALESHEGPDELDLAQELAAYTALFSDLPKTKRLPLINLQKRLLSSVEAFSRTLRAHSKRKGDTRAELLAERPDDEVDAETQLGLDEDALNEREEARVEAATAALRAVFPDGAEERLAKMRELAERLAPRPCAKTQAFLSWVREHQCPELGKRGADWRDTRVIVFTEYGDTLRYLRRVLARAIGEDEVDDRVMTFHGGMSEESREEVQFAFNADPDKDPLRILLATDAAREGLNLQARCADLFHFDIPWNPSRMEQRNGRIDRALQPAEVVRCHYFVYEQRPEDRVLEKVIEKTEIIHRELGSLGDVVAERITRALDPGIDDATEEQLEIASDLGEAQKTSDAELEDVRARDLLEREMEAARRIYEQSRKRLRFKGEHLRDALDVGLGLAGAGPLEDLGEGRFALPELGREWSNTLDGLRPPRARDEAFYEWRKRAPRPVVFEPPKVLTQSAVHLHLEHPFVQRVLSRFLAQGFSSHDLSRVTAIPMPDTGETVALALGRLCLFGAGAGRLHDTLLCVAANVGVDSLEILDGRDSAAALDRLESHLERARPSLEDFPSKIQSDLVERAPTVLAELLPALRAEADAEAVSVEQRLATRASEEANALRRILETQRHAIDEALGGSQLRLDLGTTETEKREAQQAERDRKHLERRLELLEAEIEREPEELAEIYRVLLRRFEPVGLVYLYPRMRL